MTKRTLVAVTLMGVAFACGGDSKKSTTGGKGGAGGKAGAGGNKAGTSGGAGTTGLAGSGGDSGTSGGAGSGGDAGTSGGAGSSGAGTSGGAGASGGAGSGGSVDSGTGKPLGNYTYDFETGLDDWKPAAPATLKVAQSTANSFSGSGALEISAAAALAADASVSIDRFSARDNGLVQVGGRMVAHVYLPADAAGKVAIIFQAIPVKQADAGLDSRDVNDSQIIAFQDPPLKFGDWAELSFTFPASWAGFEDRNDQLAFQVKLNAGFVGKIYIDAIRFETAPLNQGG